MELNENEHRIYMKYLGIHVLRTMSMSEAEVRAFNLGMQHITEMTGELAQLNNSQSKDDLPEKINNLSMKDFNEFMRRQME